MRAFSLLSDRRPLEFLNSFNGLWSVDDDVRIFGTQLASADPLVLSAVAAACHWIASRGKTVELVAPAMCRHLDEMRLFDCLPPDTIVSNREGPPTPVEVRKALLPVRRLESSDDVNRAVEDFRTNAEAYGGWPAGAVKTRLWISLSELLDNAREHSDSPIGSYAGAWLDDEEGPLRLAVVDLGIGIPDHLRRRAAYGHLSDQAALREAMKEGVSGVESRERGMGFVHVKKEARAVSSGQLMIRAGGAQLATRFSKRREARESSAVDPFPGTWTYLLASRPRRP